MLIVPKTISLDTSHWSKWMQSLFSADPIIRQKAMNFHSEILEKGYTIVFTWHHLEELASFDNDTVVRRRIEVLRNLPFLSWIGVVEEDKCLGSVTDIFAAEVISFMKGNKDIQSIRKHAKKILIHSGKGADVIIDHPNFFDLITYHARKRREKARTIASIIPFDFVHPKQTLGELCSGRIRTQDDRNQILHAQVGALARDILENGDQKIQSPEQVSSDFIMESMSTADSLPQKTARDLVFAALSLQGIEPNDVNDQMTLQEVGELGIFFSQLRTIAPKTGYSFDILKKHIPHNALPHRIIRNAMRKHAQKPSRRKGSDLNDEYLAYLSSYVDITYIDKRTAENFRRASQKSSEFLLATGKTQKCSEWTDIIKRIS